jgi:MoaA/NifB/PqqE/SkfB family radical SAM enzyme
MCDIWKIREVQKLTPSDLEQQLNLLHDFGVQWVVFSGGEPQRNPDFVKLAEMLRREGIRLTLLTAGMLLTDEAALITEAVDDVIVSLDGPAPIHDRIRRVTAAFHQLQTGISALRRSKSDIVIRARCTIQRENHRYLCSTVETARELKLNSISFLAADLHSTAFHHEQGWTPHTAARVALNEHEIEDLDLEVERLIREHLDDTESRYVAESPAKLRTIVRRFREYLGQSEPIAPRCNAPWISAVIEATGDVRPCFFHPVIGNIRKHSFDEIINGDEALQFRSQLDIPSNPICKRCVCSLYIPQNGDRHSAIGT